MGKKIAAYYSEAESLGGLQAKIKLASITRIPSTRADVEVDAPEVLLAFDSAMVELRKLFLNSKPKNTNAKPESAPRSVPRLPGEEELLLGLLSSLHDAMFALYDGDGRCSWAWESKTLSAQYRARPGQGPFGEQLAQLIAEEHGATIRSVMRKGEPCQIESQIEFDTGPRWFSISLTAVENTQGRSTAVGAFVQDITSRKQSEELLRQSENRLREHNRVFLNLVTEKSLFLGDRRETARRITEACSRTLGVARSSVWFYDSARSKVVCADLYERSVKEHSDGTELLARDFPAYFKALEQERTIAATDAHKDPRTSEFSVPYLMPLGISSMLDVPIWVNGSMAGVLCNEHIGPNRTFAPDEENFAYLMASFIALSMERG